MMSPVMSSGSGAGGGSHGHEKTDIMSCAIFLERQSCRCRRAKITKRSPLFSLCEAVRRGRAT